MKQHRARRTIVVLVVGAATLPALATVASQVVGPVSIRAAAARAPAERRRTVAIDEAHGNAKAASGFFKPLSDLLASEDYRVVPFGEPFERGTLAPIDLLVVATAGGPATSAGRSSSAAIGDRECDRLRDWVRGGGSLLVAAGGMPFSGEADRLAAGFGVPTGGGRVFDRVSGGGITTGLEFSRGNGRLGDHAILRGGGRAPAIARVLSAGGESLEVPRGAAILLRLSATAREAMTRDDLEAEEFAARQEAGIAGSFSAPVAGRGQAIALSFGKGRLVVLGDRYLLSGPGLSVADADNRQFALNVVHWLSRRLP